MAKKAQRGGRPSAWIKLPKDRMISLEHAEQESVAKKSAIQLRGLGCRRVSRRSWLLRTTAIVNDDAYGFFENFPIATTFMQRMQCM